MKGMKAIISLFTILFITLIPAYSQDVIPLWKPGKMPNDNGKQVSDSIANERVFRVAQPQILAFFPSKAENKRAAVLIIPGGGYVRLSHIISGTQLAKWFNTFGVNAFVLLHRMPQAPNVIDSRYAPIQDAQRALRYIRAHAQEWEIDTDKIGVMGASAGGHLASTLGTHLKDYANIGDALDTISFHPNFMLLISPVITMGKYAHQGSKQNLLGQNPAAADVQAFSNELQVTEQTPPTFIIHAFNDTSVPVNNSLLFAQALVDKGVSVSLHIFPQGAHKIELRGNPGSTNDWTTLCEEWLMEMGFLK